MKYLSFGFLFAIIYIMVGCADNQQTMQSDDLDKKDSLEVSKDAVHVESRKEMSKCALELELIAQGLVNIQDLDASIFVDLAYSDTANFMHEDVYDSLENCYLQKEVADMLVDASARLQDKEANCRLLVYDGVRPRSVQKIMWEIVKGTAQQKYVASPGGKGSVHNLGAAVDLTLCDTNGVAYDMGTPFDYFGPLAQPRYEIQFLREGKLTQEQLNNRWLLKTTMKEAGFKSILSEWWHYNGFSKEVARSIYEVVE